MHYLNIVNWERPLNQGRKKRLAPLGLLIFRDCFCSDKLVILCKAEFVRFGYYRHTKLSLLR
ncbi:hypothetical protein L2734_15625, partial [Parashewanella spongiae]